MSYMSLQKSKVRASFSQPISEGASFTPSRSGGPSCRARNSYSCQLSTRQPGQTGQHNWPSWDLSPCYFFYHMDTSIILIIWTSLDIYGHFMIFLLQATTTPQKHQPVVVYFVACRASLVPRSPCRCLVPRGDELLAAVAAAGWCAPKADGRAAAPAVTGWWFLSEDVV